jgi:hypothetical protein
LDQVGIESLVEAYSELCEEAAVEIFVFVN